MQLLLVPGFKFATDFLSCILWFTRDRAAFVSAFVQMQTAWSDLLVDVYHDY